MTDYEICKVDWNEIMTLTENVLEQIKEKEIEIDTLVPILRGGAPLSLLLASNLKNVDTACIHIRRSITNEANAAFGESVFKGITNEGALCDKNILLIEDTVDKGLTLDMAMEIVKKYNPKNVYIATLYNYNNDKYRDIIAGKKMDEKIWIVFPWELEVKYGKN